jgi:hypothetical protein
MAEVTATRTAIQINLSMDEAEAVALYHSISPYPAKMVEFRGIKPVRMADKANYIECELERILRENNVDGFN